MTRPSPSPELAAFVASLRLVWDRIDATYPEVQLTSNDTALSYREGIQALDLGDDALVQGRR